MGQDRLLDILIARDFARSIHSLEHGQVHDRQARLVV